MDTQSPLGEHTSENVDIVPYHGTVCRAVVGDVRGRQSVAATTRRQAPTGSRRENGRATACGSVSPSASLELSHSVVTLFEKTEMIHCYGTLCRQTRTTMYGYTFGIHCLFKLCRDTISRRPFVDSIRTYSCETMWRRTLVAHAM